MCNHRYIKYTRHIIYYISTFRSSFTLCLSVCLPVYYYIYTHTVCVYIITTVDPFSTIQLAFVSLSLFLFLSRPFIHSVNQYHSSSHSHSCVHSFIHSFTFLPVCCYYYSSYILFLCFPPCIYLCTYILSLFPLNINSSLSIVHILIYYFHLSF